MKKIIFVALIFLGACGRFSCRDTKTELSAEGQGKYLYEIHCASCHGSKGDGKGPVSEFLWPKPRDFTSGIFKYHTTRGPIPSDYDLLQTMKVGVPGTAMPGWDLLSQEEWNSILSYVKSFNPNLKSAKAGPSIEVPEEPKITPEEIKQGQALYQKSGCVACHGPEGKGDGPGAIVLKDTWGERIAPRNFTQGPLKWGNRAQDIYRTLVLGIPGTPMPSFEQSYTKDQMWSLVHFIQSIGKKMPEGYDPSNPKRNLILAIKTDGEIPLDYANEAWTKTAGVPVFLKPLWYEPSATEWLNVKALHNGKELAVLIEWEDNQMDATPTQADGVAIQWPLEKISRAIDLPYLGMGSAERKVNIWQWKSGVVTDFISGGIGNLEIQDPAKRNITAKGVYDQGKWHVLFKSALPAEKQGYLSFALWDGDLPAHRGPEAFSEWMIFELR